MKKAKSISPDELRPEYSRGDLGKGVRGKYFKQYRAGTNLVLLSPDVAAVFQDDKSVNDALRALLRVAEKAKDSRPRSRRTARKRAAA